MTETNSDAVRAILHRNLNVRSMKQGKLEMVKQEMARVNVDILGISELKWTGMGEFNSDNHYIYYCGQESLRRNRVAIMVNKRVQNAALGCNVKNDRMISVHFQGKPFNIMVIQVYALMSNAEEAEVEQFPRCRLPTNDRSNLLLALHNGCKTKPTFNQAISHHIPDSGNSTPTFLV